MADITDAQIFSIAQLESNCVAKKTKHRYHSTNFHFVLWLHEHHPDYVKVAVREAITIIKATTEHQPKSKQDAQLRRLIVDGYLAKVVKNEDEYMPIHLDMFVDYKVFAEYIAQKRKTVEGIQKFLSINSYTSIRSSIVHLFKMSTHSLPPDFNSAMGQFLQGMKRTIVTHKIEQGESMDEGKDAMSVDCLKLLCKKFAEGENAEYHFGWVFLLLEWNLMARSDNIVQLHMNDLMWKDDAMIMYMKKTKTDQLGDNRKVPHHVFFNSVDPYLNVGLALGMYLLTNPKILSDVNSQLFPGSNQYHRYATILKKVITENSEEFLAIGVKPQDIGTHSARKGAATLAASGCTVSPSMAAICNRAGWKLGGSRDKYIKYESAGDQFLGRTVCGLDSTGMEFSVSPPFFDMTAEELMLLDRFLMDVVPGGKKIGHIAFEVFRWCFCCVLHEYDWWNRVCDDKQRIFGIAAMTHLDVSFLICFYFNVLLY